MNDSIGSGIAVFGISISIASVLIVRLILDYLLEKNCASKSKEQANAK